MPKDKNSQRLRNVRHARVRKKVEGSPEQPRLCVFRSLKSIYAQVIDDSQGHTLASASSRESAISGAKSTGKTDSANQVGKLIAERAVSNGVSKVVFDRGGYKYHGRVKALADGAREGGLTF